MSNANGFDDVPLSALVVIVAGTLLVSVGSPTSIDLRSADRRLRKEEEREDTIVDDSLDLCLTYYAFNPPSTPGTSPMTFARLPSGLWLRG